MYLNDAQLDSGALARRLLAPTNNLVPVNLLSRQQASLEDAGTAGWAVSTNCTLARTTAQTASGSASLEVTSAAAGNAAARGTTTTTPALPGRVYTTVASVRSAVSARTVSIIITFYDAAGSNLASTTASTVTTSTSAWTEVRASGVSPANTAWALMVVTFQSTAAASEVHYIDKVGLWEGAGGSWVNGGERLDPSTLGWYWDESVGRRLFVWDTINSRWQMVYGDTGWRDVSASLSNGWAGTVYIRRMNNTVSFVGDALVKGSADTMYSLPAGFTAAHSANVVGQGFDTATLAWCPPYVGGSSAIVVPRSLIAGINQGRVNLRADVVTAWPTTLPGTASGTIPNL